MADRSKTDLRWVTRYWKAWSTSGGTTLVKHACVFSAVYVLVAIYLDPNRAYMFSEYSSKFVPFLRDAPISGWFDTWAMGDPRPRIVNVAATVLNLRIRELFSHFFVLPPALGISWLVYPITLVVLYRSLLKVGSTVLVSLSATLLWALSPSALDSLVICYVPAKSLMPLALSLLLYQFASLSAHKKNAAFTRNEIFYRSVGIGIVALLALLTDESSAIVFAVVAMLFLPTLFSSENKYQGPIVACSAFMGALGAFLLVVELIYPIVNRHFGQVPMEFFKTSILGPTAQYQSTTADAVVSSHFSGFVKNFSPSGMAFTMLSAHLLPWRLVPGFWTWSSVRSFGVWPTSEACSVFSFAGIFAILAFTLETKSRGFALRLILATMLLIALYAALLLPIAPSILEINYYGGLFSFTFAIAVAVIACGPRKQAGKQLIPALLISVLAFTEVLSFEQTSLRNRRQYSNFEYFWNQQTEKHWDYDDLRDLAREVDSGHFESQVKVHPYPSRAFAYLFELEANRQHHFGHKVDFSPMESAQSLYSVVLQGHIEWYERNGVELRRPPFPAKKTLLANGGVMLGLAEAQALMRNTTWRGFGRDWAFEQRFDNSGAFVEKYWLLSLMRLWQVVGVSRIDRIGLCQWIVANHPRQISFFLIKYGQTFYAIGRDESCLFQFVSEPDASRTLSGTGAFTASPILSISTRHFDG